MSNSLKLPVCSSCGRSIMSDEKSVKFYCSNCVDNLIWRCERCRELARHYKCIGCGFEGP
jgi:predicted RNA-binding Zn-ribbon protein involved in translation (DUF1610 family)